MRWNTCNQTNTKQLCNCRYLSVGEVIAHQPTTVNHRGGWIHYRWQRSLGYSSCAHVCFPNLQLLTNTFIWNRSFFIRARKVMILGSNQSRDKSLPNFSYTFRENPIVLMKTLENHRKSFCFCKNLVGFALEWNALEKNLAFLKLFVTFSNQGGNTRKNVKCLFFQGFSINRFVFLLCILFP